MFPKDLPSELLLGALSSAEDVVPFDLECKQVVPYKTNLPLLVWDLG